MIRPTASKVGLLKFCQWWASPEARWGTGSGSNAERGTRFHKAIAAYVEGHDDVEVEEDIREEYAHARAWVDGYWGDGYRRGVLRAEVAVAWDPESDTAVELPGKDRDYSQGEGKLCGTVDLVAITYADKKPIAAMVWDWKTGDGSGAGPQLRALGLAIARIHGLSEVTVAALEARKAGVFEVAREELDAFALAAVAGELAELLASVDGAQPQPGSHCGELYCPARLSCPLGEAATAQVVDVIPADALVRPIPYRLTDPIETPEHAAWAVDVIRLVNARLEAIKEDIKRKVPEDGWPLADGRVLREGACEQAAFDKHKALALAKQLGATAEQIASLTYTFPKSTGLRVVGGSAKPRTRRKKDAA